MDLRLMTLLGEEEGSADIAREAHVGLDQHMEHSRGKAEAHAKVSRYVKEHTIQLTREQKANSLI